MPELGQELVQGERSLTVVSPQWGNEFPFSGETVPQGSILSALTLYAWSSTFRLIFPLR